MPRIWGTHRNEKWGGRPGEGSVVEIGILWRPGSSRLDVVVGKDFSEEATGLTGLRCSPVRFCQL